MNDLLVQGLLLEKYPPNPPHTVAGLGSLSQTLTVILARPNIASESLLFRASDGVLGRPQSLSLDVAQMLVCLRSEHSSLSERLQRSLSEEESLRGREKSVNSGNLMIFWRFSISEKVVFGDTS